MHLGPLIRRYRKEKKLTLKAVSKLAGVSEGFLSQVENTLNPGFFRTVTNILFIDPTGQKGFDGIDHERFTGARLPGNHVKPFGRFPGDLLDNPEASDVQFRQHLQPGPCAGESGEQ